MALIPGYYLLVFFKLRLVELNVPVCSTTRPDPTREILHLHPANFHYVIALN